jgi:hypothetical protein
MQFVPVTTKVMSFKLKLGRGVLHLSGLGGQKSGKGEHLSGKQVDI